MKKLTFVAAALAAGLTSFAPSAYSEAPHDPYEHLQKKTEAVAAGSKGEKVDTITTGSVAATKARSSGSSYDTIIAKHAQRHGVPVALARAVVRIESNFRPNARGRAGEVGLMQIKPATARGVGYRGSVQGLYDPETNIRYGMKYLAGAHRLGGGDVCGTILRYNAGHGARRMNKTSAAYCSKVKNIMRGA